MNNLKYNVRVYLHVADLDSFAASVPTTRCVPVMQIGRRG